MPVPDVPPRRVAVLETPLAKDRAGHELTHLPTQPRCSVCVRAKGVDERHLCTPAAKRAEDQGVDHMPVIQSDSAHEVRTRTILETSTGYGTACVFYVKGSGDKYAISSAVSFLKRTGVHAISMQDGSRASDQDTPGSGHPVSGRRSRSRAGLAKGDETHRSRESGCPGGLAQAGTDPSLTARH